MELGLKDKVAIVTDGTTEIGAAITKALVAEGARVVVAVPDAAAAQRARGAFEPLAGSVVCVAHDVGQAAGATSVVADALARFGRVDIVVANADGDIVGPIADVSPDRVAALVQRKLLGPWELARAVAPHMRERGTGRVVMVISDAGKIPGRSVIASAVAGAAQHAFVKSLSDDLGRDNVLVTGVSIGHIGTPTPDEARIERDIYVCRSLGQQEARWAADVPLGRRGTADDVANAVTFLASDCASFICGTNLDVDGGDQRSIF